MKLITNKIKSGGLHEKHVVTVTLDISCCLMGTGRLRSVGFPYVLFLSLFK